MGHPWARACWQCIIPEHVLGGKGSLCQLTLYHPSACAWWQWVIPGRVPDEEGLCAWTND
eukprot:1153767-Pelagomonas_calceolata.AAC.9